MDWMDFDRDGDVDTAERYFGEELLCSSREEHMALFGNPGDFAEFLSGIDGLNVEEQWISSDVSPERGGEKWLNLLLRKI